jgi:Trypsin
VNFGLQKLFTPRGMNKILATFYSTVHISNALMHQSPCTIMPQSTCESALSGYGFNPDSSYCGQTQDDACNLDAGSALACDDGNGNYFLKGVYSSETECASPSQLVTFAKTDFSWVKTASNPTGYTSQPNRLYQTAASSITTKGQNQYLPPV